MKLCLQCKKELGEKGNKYCSTKCAYTSPLRLVNRRALSALDIEYVKTHYNVDQSLTDIAKHLGKNRTTLCIYAKNLGLTVGKGGHGRVQVTDPALLQKMSDRKKQWYQTHEHPRGMLGKTHTEETKKAISEKGTGRKIPVESVDRTLATKLKKYGSYSTTKPENVYSRGVKGWREFSNGKKYFMRSSWEMNYGCYLDFLVRNKSIKNWEYEPDTFWFENIRRGIRSYKPDFKITNNDQSIEYHEVKGYMDQPSRTKIKRMAKYYPKIKLIVIDKSYYESIKKNARLFGFTD